MLTHTGFSATSSSSSSSHHSGPSSPSRFSHSSNSSIHSAHLGYQHSSSPSFFSLPGLLNAFTSGRLPLCLVLILILSFLAWHVETDQNQQLKTIISEQQKEEAVRIAATASLEKLEMQTLSVEKDMEKYSERETRKEKEEAR